ncbi:MAG: hypothetical protein UY56_C0005G0062 [Parcubacteria group bacterium GW2011_GWA1_50_14]|nr:MAG: hypothetical protein UY56_C0005G0062 [Parcubacteria group bacterium GW2011_GWA1_50_14]
MKPLGTKQLGASRTFVWWAVFLLVAGVGVSLAVWIVFAASSGPNAPGVAATTGASGVAWTNFNNIKLEDAAVAQSTVTNVNTISQYLSGTTFGFAIPTGATIDGIKVEIKKKVGLTTPGAYATDNDVVLGGGTEVGSDYADTTTQWDASSPTWATYGGATDTWGQSWTAEQINSTAFGANIVSKFNAGSSSGSASSRTQVDFMRITVYYTETSAGTGGGGLDRRYARAVFTGYAFPRATLFIHEKGIPVAQYLLMGSDGRFEVKIEESDERTANLLFTFVDQEGRSTPPRPISVRLDKIQPPQVDISPPPTIGLQKATMTRGESLVLTGYASPRASVNVMIDGRVVDTVTAGTDGKYSSVLNTIARNITIGSHIVSVKQRFALTVGESGISATKQFFVSAFGVVRGDFNGDGAVDIKDWSIFVAKRSDPAMLAKFDLSGDGKINVVDLSIFLGLFRAGR